MNSKIKKIIVPACLMLTLAGCADMNDKHRSWLEDGEIVYIGKVDSVHAFSGDERVLFRYWISDPRAKTLNIKWSLGQESLDIAIPAHIPAEPFDLFIGRNEKHIDEGNHTFQWVAHDQHGNKSVMFETTANIYGERYQNRLNNRSIISAEADGTDVKLTWGGVSNNDEVGLNVRYVNTSDVPVSLFFATEEASSVVIRNVKLTDPVTYRTLFLPEPTAIDTFATVAQKVNVKTTINVVLNKPVAHSDINADNQGGDMAVNGDRTTATRWVTDDSNNEHWIEVDLQGFFSINAMGLWRDMSNATQHMPQFRLQAWIDDQWVDVVSEDNNELAVYYKEFESVTTDRVRWYIPPYTNNRVRLCQLEVYSITEY